MFVFEIFSFNCSVALMIFIIFSINSERFEQYAEWSHQLLPKYSKDRFYTKYTKDSSAGGALNSAYSTFRQKGHDLKDIVPVQKVIQRKRKIDGIQKLYFY